MSLSWHANVGCHLLLLLISAHAAVLPTGINTGHHTETTTGSGLHTETTTEPIHPTETTMGPSHPTETTTRPSHPTETTKGPGFRTETTKGPIHPIETTTGPDLLTETTTGPDLLIETTTGPDHATEITTGPGHPTEISMVTVLPTEMTTGLNLLTEITTRTAHSTTRGPALSAGTTEDNEVVTIIAPVVSKNDPSLDESNDAINFRDAPVTLRNTALNQQNDMNKADMDKEFADTATRFESTKSIEDNYVEQKTKDKVVTKESDEPKELMIKPTEEQVHTKDNQTPIDEKIISNTTPTKTSPSQSRHQPRILNYGGMIFKHDSNKQDNNDGSIVNFGGPTFNRENDVTFTATHQEKDSKINFGGPSKEETSIESLNEIFTSQETIGQSKRAKECKKRNMIYSVQDEKCHTPTNGGPCNPPTHWFVAQDDSWVGVCRPRLCTGQNTPFLYKGVCSPIHGKCGQGERLYNDRFGEGFCGCDDGFLYHAKEKKCYRENLRGPCGHGKQWVKKSGSWMDGVCKRRGCSGGRVKWEDGRCYKLQEGKAFQNCAAYVEGVVKPVEEKKVLGCFMEIGMRAIAPVFQGRRCRRGRVWSKYRKRCVRSFGWGR